MSVKIDNDKVYGIYRDITHSLNNREKLALIDAIANHLKYVHGSTYVRTQLTKYIKHRELKSFTPFSTIEESLRDSRNQD